MGTLHRALPAKGHRSCVCDWITDCLVLMFNHSKGLLSKSLSRTHTHRRALTPCVCVLGFIWEWILCHLMFVWDVASIWSKPLSVIQNPNLEFFLPALPFYPCLPLIPQSSAAPLLPVHHHHLKQVDTEMSWILISNNMFFYGSSCDMTI